MYLLITKIWQAIFVKQWRNSMKMWIARTEGNVLTLHQSEPKKVRMDSDTKEFFWASDIETQSFLNRNLFPEATFENSPMEVEINLEGNQDGNYDEIIHIHVDNEDGKTVSTLDVSVSELVELYMNTHFPIKEYRHLN